MKPADQKQEFINLRAEGKSYSYIADALHISKSTCSKWEQCFQADIAQLKKKELDALYEAYGMKKADRIKKLGDTLERIDEALTEVDLSGVAPERLLEYKLKYSEALKGEYISTEPAFKPGEKIDAIDIVQALGDLLNRVRAGEVTTEQANRESAVLSNLLKAYETAELKAKLDKLEAAVGRDLVYGGQY